MRAATIEDGIELCPLFIQHVADPLIVLRQPAYVSTRIGICDVIVDRE
jgi:hypothetical protein